ncbi:hypothetical protein BLNAU_16272 [Blattamonas nauphoetae]|uniref:Uncharacterized protein n=1 Tax=Blattamonas nauphoetae TaxID=2049346 RepID=A0ABQ9XDU3_9EUKA|nr:hypothetical protein BLNAU_16272 [Blattamonas nauphoetae]
MFEYSFGLQTQEVVELLTFKPFELQLLITNSSDIVAEYSSAGQITFSESMLELDKTNDPEQAPNVHVFASFSGLLFENRWEDFIRVNEAILAVVERVQRRTRLDGSELAFPPLIQADLLSEVTSTLLKVVEKKTEEHTHKLVSTAIQSSLTLDTIPEKYESLFVLSVPLLQRSISFLLHLWTEFASLVEREPTTVSSFVSLLRFVSLLQNWQLTLTGIKSFVHIFYSLLHTKDPRLSLLFQLAAHCHPSLPLLPFSTLLQRRLANKVCGAGEVDLCVLTLSSLLTNTHVAVPSSTRNQVKAVGVLSTRKRRETRKSVSAFEEKMSETEAQNSKPAAEQDEPKEQADDDNELFQSHS